MFQTIRFAPTISGKSTIPLIDLETFEFLVRCRIPVQLTQTLGNEHDEPALADKVINF